MALTPAKRRANDKYIKNNLEQIAIREPKGVRDRWKAAAEAVGESFAGFIAKAIEERIEREGIKIPDTASAQNEEPAVTESIEPVQNEETVQSEVKQPEPVKKTSSVFKKIRERENGSK